MQSKSKTMKLLKDYLIQNATEFVLIALYTNTLYILYSNFEEVAVLIRTQVADPFTFLFQCFLPYNS